MSAFEPKTTAPQGQRHFDSSKLWSQKSRAGVYSNPIIHADYSDPDVVRRGEDFYLVSSSFNCTPGLPILHSKDLVNWRIVNHAVENLPSERYNSVQHGGGVWAPSIRWHAGKFWVVFPMPDEGIYVTTAEDPAGEWSEPHLLHAGKGLIDPCPLWDDDGAAYLVHAFAHSRTGVRHRLQVCPMAPDCSRLLGEGEIVFEQPDRHPIIEGPKFLKRDGWYYILAPAGGVATGWQTVLRSRSVYGPYDDQIVLEQGQSAVNGPHQGALVDTPHGDWWFIHFQDAGVYGRITHLQPVRWEAGWPRMGVDQDGNGIGEPVAQHRVPMPPVSDNGLSLAASDTFSAPRLGRQWQWNANHSSDWYSLEPSSSRLRLFARPAPGGKLQHAPHLLLQKFPKRSFTATTHLVLPDDAEGTRAGLVVVGSSYSGLLVSRRGDLLSIERVACEGLEETQPEVVVDADLRRAGQVWLRVRVASDAMCEWSYSLNGVEFTRLGPSTPATAGVWIGARVGLVCTGEDRPAAPQGYADFQSFVVQ